MEASVLQENLNRVLRMTRPFTYTGHLQSTSMVKLTTEKSGVRVEANDLEKSISIKLGAQVHEEGGICVDAAKLKAFVETLPDERIELRTRNGDGPLALLIESADSDATMTGMEPSEFPPLQTVPKPQTAMFDPEELGKALNRVLRASAKEDSRPVLSGVNIVLGDNGYRMAAADGYRLAIQAGPLAKTPKKPTEAIIPRSTLEAVLGLLRDQDENVKLEIADGGDRVRFTLKGCQIVSFAVLGQFPNFDNLVPDQHDWTVQATVDAFRNAVKSAGVYASVDSNVVRFTTAVEDESRPDHYTVRVAATAETLGDAKREIMGAVTTGLKDAKHDHAGKIAFDAKYVTDLLAVIEGRIFMGATTPSSPALWRLEGDDNFVAVIMPMFVQW